MSMYLHCDVVNFFLIFCQSLNDFSKSNVQFINNLEQNSFYAVFYQHDADMLSLHQQKFSSILFAICLYNVARINRIDLSKYLTHFCYPIKLVLHQHLNSHVAYPGIPPENSNHTRGQYQRLPLRVRWQALIFVFLSISKHSIIGSSMYAVD